MAVDMMPTRFNMEELAGLTVHCPDNYRWNITDIGVVAADVASLGSLLSDENGLPRLASSCYCPLTMAVMEDPVQDREGNSYEREAILRWLETKDTSPITRNKLKRSHLTPNRALKEAIEFEGKRRKKAVERKNIATIESALKIARPLTPQCNGATRVINKCLSEMKLNIRLDSWGIAFVPMNYLKKKLNMLMVIEAPPSRDSFRLCTHFDSAISKSLSAKESDCNRVMRNLILFGKHGALTLKKVNNSMRFCFEGNSREISRTDNFRDTLSMFVEVTFRMNKKLTKITENRK